MKENTKKAVIYLVYFFLITILFTFFSSEILHDVPKNETEKVAHRLGEAVEAVEDHGFLPDNFLHIRKQIVNHMLQQLDPHSYYMLPEEYKEIMQEYWGYYAGLGLNTKTIKGHITVISVTPGSPSDDVGLQPGDQIHTINGESVTGENAKKAGSMVKGKIGTLVALGVKRPGRDKLLSFEIERQKINIPSVQHALMYNKTTGYIKLHKFTNNTLEEFSMACAKLHKKGMKRLIVDLRNNPGGYLDVVIKLSGKFLPADRVITSVKKRVKRQINDTVTFKTTTRIHKSPDNKPKWVMPLIVLVNSNSASSSEIFAGAIQDNDRGLIIGQRTFGKALIQGTFEFSDMSALALTIGKYFTPGGRLIQKKYKGISLDAYYYSSKKKKEFRPSHRSNDSTNIYKTVLGRKMDGSGGISPDIVADNSDVFSYSTKRLFDSKLLFGFVFEHGISSLKKLEELSNERLIALLSDYLADTRYRNYSEFINNNIQEIRFLIKSECVYILEGADAAKKLLMTRDNYIRKSIENFPSSISLWEKSRKMKSLAAN